MINFKQMELGQKLFEQLKKKFPEIELVDITESMENSSSIWVSILIPFDEDREIELIELAGDLSTDILLEYGYSISISINGYLEITKNKSKY